MKIVVIIIKMRSPVLLFSMIQIAICYLMVGVLYVKEHVQLLALRAAILPENVVSICGYNYRKYIYTHMNTILPNPSRIIVLRQMLDI